MDLSFLLLSKWICIYIRQPKCSSFSAQGVTWQHKQHKQHKQHEQHEQHEQRIYALVCPSQSCGKRPGRFTLIELMVAVAVVRIRAAIALPSYASSINKSRAKGASADLAALALNKEHRYQLQLSYPVYAANTAATTTIFSAWSPAQASDFNDTMVSTASSYTSTATGKGSSAGCTITLDNLNARTSGSACGFTSW